MKRLEEEVLNRALQIKDEYIKMKDTLAVSMRKDVIIAELKDILSEHTNFYGLKNALEEYIHRIEGEINGKPTTNF